MCIPSVNSFASDATVNATLDTVVASSTGSLDAVKGVSEVNIRASLSDVLHEFQDFHQDRLKRRVIIPAAAAASESGDPSFALRDAANSDRALLTVAGVFDEFVSLTTAAAFGRLTAKEYRTIHHTLVMKLLSITISPSNEDLQAQEAFCISKLDRLDLAIKRFDYGSKKTAEQLMIERYSPLIGRKVYIGFNLFNSENILSNFLYQLLRLIAALGPQNVFVATYENGSEDHTKNFLVELDLLLSFFSVPHHIEYSFDGKLTSAVHRIEYLAAARNRVLESLRASSTVYDKVGTYTLTRALSYQSRNPQMKICYRVRCHVFY